MATLSQKDRLLVACLRENARMPLTTMSRRVRVPVSTLWDRLRVLDQEVVRKHASLLAFDKLGLVAHAFLAISAKHAAARDEIEQRLRRSGVVNNLYRLCTAREAGLLAEVVLPSLRDLETLLTSVQDDTAIVELKVFHVSEEVLREEYLATPELEGMPGGASCEATPA